jgi:3-oxoacyl-[acyl-carrier protein] reductase
VAPGFIDTDMTKNMTDEAKSQVNGMIPMGKMGTTSDIANLVLFLAGENSNYITGQVICVDGGMAI